MVRLPERARIFPSWTSTAPMGTSPAAAAERASAKASCMNWISASILGERISRGKRGNGINPENRRINADTQSGKKRNGINTEGTESTEDTEQQGRSGCLTIAEGRNKLGACGNSSNDCFKWIF